MFIWLKNVVDASHCNPKTVNDESKLNNFDAGLHMKTMILKSSAVLKNHIAAFTINI